MAAELPVSVAVQTFSYPNPGRDFLRIGPASLAWRGRTVAYRIVSAGGNVVAHGEMVNGSIDARALRSGCYFVEWRDLTTGARRTVRWTKVE